MLTGWELPRTACIGGKRYPIHADFRDILEIFAYLDDPDMPEFIRWQVALALFYEGQIPPADQPEAMTYLVRFLNGGREETAAPGPKRIDWQQDAEAIVSDVNRVAGQEIRALPFLHWWTFLSWFHGIGQGQVATLVSIRDKLNRGKPLENWEKEFYRQNRQQVELKKRYSREELAQRQRLEKLLNGK